MNLIKSTGTFSFFTIISRILGYLRDILIAIFLGSGPVADAFFVAFRIPNTFRRLFSEGTFNAAFVPSYASEIANGKEQSEKFATNNIQDMGKIAMQSAKIIFWTTIPLASILLLFPRFFMGLYGGEFLIGFEALRWLIIGRVVNALSGSVGNVMQMSGQQNSYMNILIIGALINILLNYFLIPIYGINGAALASVFSLSFWNLSMVYIVKRRFGFSTIYLPFLRK